MIRPLTELGVGRLIPLITDRTEAKLKDSNVLSKIQKWEKIAREACKQSGTHGCPYSIHLRDFRLTLRKWITRTLCYLAVCLLSLKSVKISLFLGFQQ